MRFWRNQTQPIKAKPRKASDDDCDNETERQYLAHLEALYKAGEIVAFVWKPWRMRLAKGLYYEPEALVVTNDGYLEIHEVKGQWQDTAKAKWKVGREKFWMLPYVLVKKVAKKNGTWLEIRDPEG